MSGLHGGHSGGPAPALFLNALPAIAQALTHQQHQDATAPTVVSITMTPAPAAPAPPTSGWIWFVDPVSGDLSAISSLGNVRVLATP